MDGGNIRNAGAISNAGGDPAGAEISTINDQWLDSRCHGNDDVFSNVPVINFKPIGYRTQTSLSHFQSHQSSPRRRG